MRTSSILVLLLAIGCVPASTTAPPTAAAPPPTTTTSSSVDDEHGASMARAPARLEVVGAEGLIAEHVQKVFAPAAEPMSRCLPGGTGKIMLRVTGRMNELAVTIDPSLMLDDAARACAIAALTAVYLEQTGSRVGGPAIPPTGFTSLITVVW